MQSQEFLISFEVPEYLFITFGKVVLNAGQTWNAEHLTKIERIVEGALSEDHSIISNSSLNQSIPSCERRTFWQGTRNNLLLFIRGFFNKHFENYQDDLIKKARLINFDLVIKRDFENCEKGKKSLLMSVPVPNLTQNPHYFLNKTIYLYYFQKRITGKDFSVSSKTLLNVF